MFWDALTTAAGIALLIAGGEVLVRGASALAARLHISPLAIGLTVVAFGTSAPELAVNLAAAFAGNTALSFGNIFGSNMANTGLVVALTALFAALKLRDVATQHELPVMFLATAAAAALAVDEYWLGGAPGFTRGEGLLLLLLFGAFGAYVWRHIKGRPLQNGAEGLEIPGYGAAAAAALTVAGIALLVVGGEITVHGAVELARAFGVSETIVGLSVVAVGTSLPELSASLYAVLRGHGALALGNIIGSNIFNLLLVLAATAVVRAVPLPAGGLYDLLITVILAAQLWLMCKSGRLIKLQAALLLIIYGGYLGARLLFAVQHAG